MGNITSRSDVAGGATWTYHATKKHAVVQAGSSAFTYSYDANGNAQTRNGYALDWTSYNYPSVIRGPNKTMAFSYGPDRQRFKQIYTNGSSIETTMYIGGLLEKVTSNGVTDWRHYISGGSGAVAVVSRKSTGVNTTRYLLEDHQGSVSQILDSSGAIYVSENFTAFGARRDASTWSGACPCPDLTKIKDTTRRGYTGHEAIGGVSMGLNHMNGRVQDAITGRFLSPDPYVQAPGFTQSFNRYSYTFNNPLSYTDPSGFQAAPPEVEPPRGPGLDVIGGPYSGIADFHARAAWARLYGIRNAMARWMRNTHPEFFSTPTQFANSRIAGGTGGGNPGSGHAGGGNTGGPGSEPPHEDFREHQVGSGLVGGANGGNGTWGDFAFGAARGAADDVARTLITAGAIQSLYRGDFINAYIGLRYGSSAELFGAPDSNRGQFGYDLGPAVTVVAGGFVGGIRGAASRGTTFLYQKVGSLGEHLKFGITTNPATRYTAEELAGGRLRILARGLRADMLALERKLHETLPIGAEEGQSFYIQLQVEKGLLPPWLYPFPP